MIDKIISKNKQLLKDITSINKVNVGFTNTIYILNNKYVIKICTDIKNEPKFKKEIDFYNKNQNNNLIPKLYLSDISKKDIPYMYEIIEKVEGKTLFNVWHTLNENEREDIIKQLCLAMKEFHSHTTNKYDWSQKTKDIFNPVYNKAKELNLFNKDEISLIDKAYSLFDKYLESNEFVLVHNDLHFDNIFYNNKKIKLIDFERSLYAPKDFELDIIYRMVRKPYKFASEETEKYTKESDYKNIMKYIEKYYPELIKTRDLYKRLYIYDIVYYMKQYIEYTHLNELKENILYAAKQVVEDK